MRLLITGANGMLGHDLQKVFANVTVSARGHADLDITDLAAVHDAVAGHDVVINAAAITNVDDAERHEDRAYAVNAQGAENVAVACSEAGARLVHISTDYVFDGKATTPYAENAPLSPLSIYGRSKAEGETLAHAAHPEGIVILRTAWLYGEHGNNFAKAILEQARTRETVSVTDDQRGQPTWTMDVAHQIAALLARDIPPGIYHATNSGSATRFEFAQALFEDAGLDPARVLAISSDELHRPAPRPAYSVLGHDAWHRVGVDDMRQWRNAQKSAFTEGALFA